MISSLISSLYVAPQLAHIHLIHGPHQSFHLASQPPTWGQIALSRCSPMRCISLILSRVFLHFWILFPVYQTCILFGEQLDKPGANCPVTIFSCLPHTPESPDLQRQWCIRLRHLKYWTNGGIQHRPTRLICATGLWKIWKKVSHSLNIWTV